MYQIQKVHHSALIITPPQELTNQIQNIRMNNDKAYDRWMPHINICFPFVDPQQFPPVHQQLQNHLIDFPAFDVSLNEFKYFDHGNKGVMYLNPEAPQIQQILNEILKIYPQLNDQIRDNEYHPHLTVGQFSSNIIAKKQMQLQKQFKQIQFKCSQLHMIARDGKDNPFEIIHSIQLKQNIE